MKRRIRVSVVLVATSLAFGQPPDLTSRIESDHWVDRRRGYQNLATLPRSAAKDEPSLPTGPTRPGRRIRSYIGAPSEAVYETLGFD